MNTVLRTAIPFAVRRLVAFIIILAILLFGKWAHHEWQQWQRLDVVLDDLRQQQRAVDRHLEKLRTQLTGEADQWHQASVAKLDTLINLTERRIDALSTGLGPPPLSVQSLLEGGVPQRVGEYFMRKGEVELLRQKREYLERLRTVLSRRAARAELERLRIDHVNVYEALQRNLQEQQRLGHAHRVLVWVPGTAPYRQSTALTTEEHALRARNTAAHAAYQRQKALLDKLVVLQPLQAFSIDESRLKAVGASLRKQIDDFSALRSVNWLRQAWSLANAEMWIAASILLSACVVPIAIKTAFYYVLAPLAARRPPVRLDQRVPSRISAPVIATVFAAGRQTISSVSHAITLGNEEQLLVHPQYIQSTPTGIRSTTQWLLDWSCPFTSIAAGLVALTCVQAEQPETLIISATDDPLEEIALLTLPAGAALVLQPRTLVGTVSRKDQPLVIERHWRLCSLHAWLTLQLRYLVFRGPVTLIVKGCRGVKVEPAGTGRRISQSATIGFSVDVNYSTSRTETFFPYLSGKQSLFLDKFDGHTGVYVYEEIPRAGRKPGAWGRGLEGATDAVLKVFGV